MLEREQYNTLSKVIYMHCEYLRKSMTFKFLKLSNPEGNSPLRPLSAETIQYNSQNNAIKMVTESVLYLCELYYTVTYLNSNLLNYLGEPTP